MDNKIMLVIDGTTYEYSMDDFQALCDGELPAQENILRHILRLHKGRFDVLAAEMRDLRERIKGLEADKQVYRGGQRKLK